MKSSAGGRYIKNMGDHTYIHIISSPMIKHVQTKLPIYPHP